MPRDEQIAEAAREWFARLHLDQPGDGDHQEFRRWCALDSRNAEAYKRLAEIWHETAALEATDVSTSTRSPSLSRWIRYAAAAAVVLTVGAFASWRMGLLSTQSYATQTAEVRDMPLPDGSTLTLGARSAVAVRFTESERHVTLNEGEAYFTVARNPSRPFVVLAGGSRVRAVGTQFEVRLEGKEVRVAVVEGIVEVSRPNELPQTLSAGQQLTAQSGGGVSPPQQIRTPEPAAWRNGRLVYIDAPLSEIVADANRYSRTHIDIAGEGIENLRLSVTYRADQVEQMIDSLPRSLPVELTRAESGRATLRARADSH